MTVAAKKKPRFVAWPDSWPIYDSLSDLQQKVVRLLWKRMAWQLVKVRVGDRWLVVPPGGVLFSERCLSKLAGTSRGNVISVLRKLEDLLEADVFRGGSATWPKPKGPHDPGHDPGHDPLHDPVNRISPSLLVWRNLDRFRVRSIELVYSYDPSRDPGCDPDRDPAEEQKPRKLSVVKPA